MTPLQKCRNALELSLPALEQRLNGVTGGSKTTLSRLETKQVNHVNKNLLTALVEVFKEQGLTAQHIISPELFTDFNVKYNANLEKSHCQQLDGTFNEQSILLELTKQWFESSNMTQTKFAENLHEKLSVDGLVATAPTNMAEYTTWHNSALKRVSRILENEQPFPLSWKYYWLACLPKEIEHAALSQMMANAGYMLIPLPTTANMEAKGSAAKIHEISREFSDVIARSKPAMDGVYDDRDDLGELQLLQDELAELTAACHRESTAIERSTGVTSKLQQIWAASPLRK